MSGDTISSEDRGYLYGDALFETVRVSAGRVRWLDRHHERLRASGRALGFASAWIEQACTALAALPEREDGIWRVTVSRPGRTAPLGGAESITTRWRPYVAPQRPALVPVTGFYLPDDPLAGHKTSNYLRQVEARRRAVSSGFDDALLVARDGRIGEACFANVFVVFDDHVATPPLEGILPGVTRRGLIELASLHDQPVVERPIRIGELERCREIALSSAGVGVVAAANLQGRPLDDTWAREAARWLSEVDR